MDEALFVFDKDGVIFDSEPIKLAAIEALFSDYPDQLEAIKAYNRGTVGMARYEKFRHILSEILGQEADTDRLDGLMAQAKESIREPLKRAPVIPGALEFIRKAPPQRYLCSIAPMDEIRDQLAFHQLEDCFVDVFGFPSRKREVLLKLKAASGGRPLVFFGDTILDFNAAKEAEVTFIGIHQPDRVDPFEGLQVPVFENFSRPGEMLDRIRDSLVES